MRSITWRSVESRYGRNGGDYGNASSLAAESSSRKLTRGGLLNWSTFTRPRRYSEIKPLVPSDDSSYSPLAASRRYARKG